jgi:parvulin-like peptidyl-prolyl isomerase
MLRIFLSLIFASAIFGFASADLSAEEPVTATGSGSTYIDSIAATVNGEIITHGALDYTAKQMRREKKLVLEREINGIVILQTAKKEGIIVTDAELDKRLDAIIKSVGGKEKFEQVILAPIKVSYEKYQDDFRSEMIKDKYVTSRLNRTFIQENKDSKPEYVVDIFISPKEIRDYYEVNKSKFTGGIKVKTRQIILQFQDDISRNSKRNIAQALLEEAKSGENFAALASKFSDINASTGGLWDYTGKGVFPAKVDEVIFSLKAGEISSVIETDSDYRIVLIEDRFESSGNLDSPEIQKMIKKVLHEKKFNEAMVKIKRELIKKADVWIDPKLGFSWSDISDTSKPDSTKK